MLTLGYTQHSGLCILENVYFCNKDQIFRFSEVLERLQTELEEGCSMNFQSPIADDIKPKDILPNVFEGKLVSEVHILMSIFKTTIV